MPAVVTEVIGGLIGSGSIIAGLVAARWIVRRPTKPTGPVCSCSHGYSIHGEDGECYGETRRRHYNSLGHRAGYKWVSCRCVRYDGPTPLSEVWVPPMNEK